jgi:hypothetical protein
MPKVMRYPIPRISSTCADFILDPSYMVMSVDLFNKSRVPINFLTTLKAVVNLAASHWIISLIGFYNQCNLYRFIPTWIT